ncbi:MAG: glycosyltransferase, partial [Smithellaceae bacterium]|nr:glycosyltransferase [Smithellaceae bacterium]
MVSVVIPTLNEEATIARVVGVAKKCKLVDEVIVVDDHSFDNTVDLAKKAGASVIMSTKIGKG